MTSFNIYDIDESHLASLESDFVPRVGEEVTIRGLGPTAESREYIVARVVHIVGKSAMRYEHRLNSIELHVRALDPNRSQPDAQQRP